MINTPATELKGIRKTCVLSYNKNAQKVLALDGIDLTINLGEFLIIIGPSGCGKTTRLRIMASFTTPEEGEVIVAGKAVTEHGIERAMVFQAFGLFAWKTVIDNVMFPLTVRKFPQAHEIAMALVSGINVVQISGLGESQALLDGHYRVILEKRKAVYEEAKSKYPNRWSGETHNW